MIRVVVFDFDDTLVRSERVKEEAYVEVFRRLPGAKNFVHEYLAAHREENRFQKITGLVGLLGERGVLPKDEKGALAARYVNEYTVATERAVVAAADMPGARGCLASLVSSHALYVNSATPQDSLNRIVEARGLGEFFRRIYGAPPGTKEEHLGEILAAERAAPIETVVVGDSVKDYDAAHVHGCHFVGVNGEFSDFFRVTCPVISELSAFPKLIHAL